MTSEIVRVEITSVSGAEAKFRDVTTGRTGTLAVNGFHVTARTTITIEIDTRHGRLIRILDPKPATPTDADPTSEQAPPAVILVNGQPFEVATSAEQVSAGEVRSADVPFTSHQTADRDTGKVTKRRPIIVLAVDGDHVKVLPIHGSNSAVAHNGGRRLTGWREIGLRKPSVVSPESIWVEAHTLGPVIGLLTAADRQRIGLDKP